MCSRINIITSGNGQGSMLGASLASGASGRSQNIAFGSSKTEASKYGWYCLKKISSKMKDASEITNALIAAIGTGIIAPLTILISPGKGDKDDKDKKFFKAIRQPLSAFLSLAFQVPMTMLIYKSLNHLVYEKGWFEDETIGKLIPNEKYFLSRISKNDPDYLQLVQEFDADNSVLKAELRKQITDEYEEVGITPKTEKVEKEIAKRKKNFLKGKIARKLHEERIEAKFNELKTKSNIDIKDTDLVTEDHKKLVKARFEEHYALMEERQQLSFRDRLARIMGFSTKKLEALKKAGDEFATKEGLKIVQEEMGDKFNDDAIRLRKFIEAHEGKAQKYFENKKFYISLLVNLVMVTASCYALNWLHPRFKILIDKIRNKNDDSKKVEVAA